MRSTSQPFSGGRVFLVFLGLTALAGCESIEVGLGMRMRLDKVTALSATLSPGPGLSPGKSGRLIITANEQRCQAIGHGWGGSRQRVRVEFERAPDTGDVDIVVFQCKDGEPEWWKNELFKVSGRK